MEQGSYFFPLQIRSNEPLCLLFENPGYMMPAFLCMELNVSLFVSRTAWIQILCKHEVELGHDLIELRWWILLRSQFRTEEVHSSQKLVDSLSMPCAFWGKRLATVVADQPADSLEHFLPNGMPDVIVIFSDRLEGCFEKTPDRLTKRRDPDFFGSRIAKGNGYKPCGHEVQDEGVAIIRPIRNRTPIIRWESDFVEHTKMLYGQLLYAVGDRKKIILHHCSRTQ